MLGVTLFIHSTPTVIILHGKLLAIRPIDTSTTLMVGKLSSISLPLHLLDKFKTTTFLCQRLFGIFMHQLEKSAGIHQRSPLSTLTPHLAHNSLNLILILEINVKKEKSPSNKVGNSLKSRK